MNQTFKHFSHAHGLVFHQLQHGSEVQCSGCKTPGSGNFYVCWQCSYFLHEQCYLATRSLKNPLHPLHPLTLVPYPTHPSNTFFCNTCNLVGNGLSYCCAECDFDLHVHCANVTNPTSHLSPFPVSNGLNHQNPIYPPIQNNPFPNYPPHNPTNPNVSHPPNTTYSPVPNYPPLPQSHPFPVFPQPNPTGLPNFNPPGSAPITNPTPPSQPNPIQPIYTPPLTATTVTPSPQPNPPPPTYTPPPPQPNPTLPTYTPPPPQPNPPLPTYTPPPPPQPNPPLPTYTPPPPQPQPQPNPPLPTYTPPVNNIGINPNPPPPVSQPNPVQPPQNNIPTLIKHFSHHHVLKAMDIDKKNVKVCSACECELFGSAYCCTEGNCNFNLHKACFDSPREVRHKCHLEHPLTLLTAPPYPDGFTCNACLKEGKAFAYNCATCSYDLHIDCITWPESVARQDHKHDLNLYYSSPAATSNQDVVFMCDVCNNPVHEMAWLYYCRECDYGTHLECVASGMQANVNLGKTDEVAISESELAFAMLQLLLNGGRPTRN